MAAIKILIVDDDELPNRIMRSLLECEGFALCRVVPLPDRRISSAHIVHSSVIRVDAANARQDEDHALIESPVTTIVPRE